MIIEHAPPSVERLRVGRLRAWRSNTEMAEVSLCWQANGMYGGVSMGAKNNVLVVDDDRKVARQVQTHLEKLGYEVSTVADARAAMDKVQASEPDLVVLDINFPESETEEPSIDGIELLRKLRESTKARVLMLSATKVSAVKVMALSMGADDYVSKPFDVEELGARVGAILRRDNNETLEKKTLEFKHIKLDPSERRVWKDGELVELTKLQFEMLYTLARRPDHVFTREKLLELAWEGDNCIGPKVVDVHIGHIRKKIEEDPGQPRLIVTVRSVGYRFQDSPV